MGRLLPIMIAESAGQGRWK